MITPETLASSGTEHGHQTALFCWANGKANELYNAGCKEKANALQLMFAIPNGGERHKAVSAKLKAEGVKAGVPDIMLPVARIVATSELKPIGEWLLQDVAPYHGLFIEMKKPSQRPKREASKGGVKDNQDDWHNMLRHQGYAVYICYSWEEARDVVCGYLGVKP